MADDWPQVRIRLLGKVVTGKTPNTRDSANFGDEFPFITIPDLNGRVFIDSTERGLSKQGAGSIQSSLLPANAVMMSCIATVGKCGITTRPSFTNQQINSVICNDRVNPQFLYYFDTVTTRTFETSQVVVPPVPLISKFGQHIQPAMETIRQSLRQSQTLASLRDALLPRLISGELRVPDVERIVGRCV